MHNIRYLKVCGMKDLKNIQDLAALPIQYVGHIFYSKSPRYADALAHWESPSSIKKTGVFVNATFEEISTYIKRFDLRAVQLHGNESPTLCAQIQQENVEVIKAFGIHEKFDWSILKTYQPAVDYFLFDTRSDQFGGTGKTFGWENLRHYSLKTPYFLSGGLSLENLEEALAFQDERLVGLDLNSRFEISPGIKDIAKIKLALKVINHE